MPPHVTLRGRRGSYARAKEALQDVDTKIDPASVRSLRERRAWSQEQLAEIAGLNVRTVQRVESTGSASPETRMALAAALEVTPAELCTPPAAAPPQAGDRRPQGDRPARWFQIHMVAIGWTLLVMLYIGFAYVFGRDLAKRDNAEACSQAEQHSACRGAPATKSE